MTVMIQGDQTPGKQLIPVRAQNFQKCITDYLGDRTLDPQLDDTGKARAPECEHARKVKILCDDHRAVITCTIKDCVVGITEVSDVRPMGGGDSVESEVIAPSWRKVLIDDQIHDARS
jgi:hypothetical protein